MLIQQNKLCGKFDGSKTLLEFTILVKSCAIDHFEVSEKITFLCRSTSCCQAVTVLVSFWPLSRDRKRPFCGVQLISSQFQSHIWHFLMVLVC